MHNIERILLAEDDPRDVELTISGFEESKLANEVVVVEDGAQALDFLYRRGKFHGRREGNPALVLLDLKMPKVDGLGVLRAIRADVNLHMIPVVILTSSREESDLVESYRLNVNAFVVKPVVFSDFIGVIKELGLFWAVINEPPPGSIARPVNFG